MKHTVITAALLCALTSPAFAADGQNADPNDPCAMVPGRKARRQQSRRV